MNASIPLVPLQVQALRLHRGHVDFSDRLESAAHGVNSRKLTTAELATALSMREQSIRKRLSQTGSYFGLRPVKLPSGRLQWPADSIELLIAPSKSFFEGSIQ